MTEKNQYIVSKKCNFDAIVPPSMQRKLQYYCSLLITVLSASSKLKLLM